MNVSSSKFIKFVEAMEHETSKLPKYSSRFSRKDYTIRQHVSMLCIKIKVRQRYREFCEILDLMPEIKHLLNLDKAPH